MHFLLDGKQFKNKIPKELLKYGEFFSFQTTMMNLKFIDAWSLFPHPFLPTPFYQLFCFCSCFSSRRRNFGVKISINVIFCQILFDNNWGKRIINKDLYQSFWIVLPQE